MDIRKIVLPTDFLEGSQKAAEAAVGLARKFGARICLIHVIHDLEKATGWYVPHMAYEELYRDIEAGAAKELERIFADELKGFTDVEKKLVRGIPHEEIIKFADASGADLIVMGTHGRKGLDRVLFGSTAENVVKRSKCPVLTVRV